MCLSMWIFCRNIRLQLGHLYCNCFLSCQLMWLTSPARLANWCLQIGHLKSVAGCWDAELCWDVGLCLVSFFDEFLPFFDVPVCFFDDRIGILNRIFEPPMINCCLDLFLPFFGPVRFGGATSGWSSSVRSMEWVTPMCFSSSLAVSNAIGHVLHLKTNFAIFWRLAAIDLSHFCLKSHATSKVSWHGKQMNFNFGSCSKAWKM